jgi:ADP-ribose pyrophosphatase YjhB (NUDIX family)
MNVFCYSCGECISNFPKRVFPMCETCNLVLEKKDYFRVGAGILFTDGKKILLLKRSGSDHESTWSIPGGRSEENETPINTAKRETKEECGRIEGYKIDHFQNKKENHIFHTYLYIVSKPFDCELSKEHSKWKWVKIKNVEKMNLHPRFKDSWKTILKSIVKYFSFKKSFSEWFESRQKK